MDSLVQSSKLSASAPEFVPSGMNSYEVRVTLLCLYSDVITSFFYVFWNIFLFAAVVIGDRNCVSNTFIIAFVKSSSLS